LFLPQFIFNVAAVMGRVKRCRHGALYFVTTGLDPVVHAEMRLSKTARPNQRMRRMDCRQRRAKRRRSANGYARQ
jgi:hypothetical protein